MQRTIRSKSHLRDFIRTQLGEEYNCLEISDRQLDNIIEMAIQKYSEYAYDGLKERALILPIVIGQTDYKLGDELDKSEPEIYSVTDIIEESKLNTLLLNYSFGDSTMVLSWIGTDTFWYKFLDYEIFGGYLEMYNKIYKKKTSYTWDEPSQTFHIFEEPKENTNLALIINQYHSNSIGLYNKNWVKEYTTEQARLTWGRNMMKMAGVTFPGGATLNYDGIIAEAKEEIQRLNEELIEALSAPSEFFIG